MRIWSNEIEMIMKFEIICKLLLAIWFDNVILIWVDYEFEFEYMIYDLL